MIKKNKNKEVVENKHRLINSLEYVKWMKFILRRAEEVGRAELPITAVILDSRGRCIGRGSNRRETKNDPLGHAELVALKQASLIIGDWRFNDCIIIINLEPCTMCAAALVQARIGKVIYGAGDKKRGGFGGTIDLSKHESAHHKMVVVPGILQEECEKKLRLWFKNLRNQT